MIIRLGKMNKRLRKSKEGMEEGKKTMAE